MLSRLRWRHSPTALWSCTRPQRRTRLTGGCANFIQICVCCVCDSSSCKALRHQATILTMAPSSLQKCICVAQVWPPPASTHPLRPVRVPRVAGARELLARLHQAQEVEQGCKDEDPHAAECSGGGNWMPEWGRITGSFDLLLAG